MNLYLDDNSVKRSVVGALRRADHQVVLPADVGLAPCATQGRVLLTRDHEDFFDSHVLVQATLGRHAGILAICSDNDPSRDMKDRDIVRAIANLERAGIPIANDYIILNHWR